MVWNMYGTHSLISALFRLPATSTPTTILPILTLRLAAAASPSSVPNVSHHDKDSPHNRYMQCFLCMNLIVHLSLFRRSSHPHLHLHPAVRATLREHMPDMRAFFFLGCPEPRCPVMTTVWCNALISFSDRITLVRYGMR